MLSVWPRTRIRTAGVLVFAVLLAMPAGPVMADTPYLRTTTVASAPIAAPGTPETFSGTLTPVGGTFYSVSVQIRTYASFDDRGGPFCVPASCIVDDFRDTVRWDFPVVDQPISMSVDTFAAPGKAVGFAVTYCDPNDCLVQNSSVTVQSPTVSVDIARSPTGTVMPGDTLHFTVSGSANAGPVGGDLQAKLSDGLADPTNVGCGTWSPAPYRYVDCNTSLDLTQTYSFDTQVTAALGSDVTAQVNFYPAFGVNGTLTKTLVIHVGASPTPTPRPTAAPTARPPTPAPATPPPATPTPQPSPPESAFAGSPSESAASTTEAATPPSTSVRSASAAPSQAGQAAGGGPLSLPVLLIAGGAGGAAAAGVAAFAISRRRHPSSRS